ncbi:glycogen debranching enzyme [Fonsecaea monophora]|uniref:Glycogen debranching enzyme n=1 Tax=Fonsecaea monophora TaxID=254056 RepID=A0A177FFL8_9EURO|nr:glycogen debranching enzyme [Fonsecaea monophora]OAG42252.1 glycogen debranching enzyme [Fonsecaea monophora]
MAGEKPSLEESTGTRDVPIQALGEDSMTWRSAFTPRVILNLFFLGIANASATGIVIFLSILLNQYQATFGPSTISGWTPIAHLTVATCLFPLSGRWSDLIGRRYFFIAANVFAVIGNIICAKADSFNMMIAGSAVSGVSTACNQLAQAAMQELVPNQFKPYVLSILSVTTIPIQFAPLIAGSFVSDYSISWRGCWWVMTAINGSVLVGIVALYFPPDRTTVQEEGTLSQRSLKYEVIHFDWIGFVVLAGSLTSMLIGLQWGGTSYPWSSGHVLGPLITGIVALIGFCIYEAVVRPEIPLVSMKLLGHVRSFVMPTIVVGVSAMCYYSLNILWPLMIASLWTSNARTQSYFQMVAPVANIIGGTLYGPIAKKLKFYKYQMVVGVLIQGAFTAALAASDSGSRVMSSAFVAVASFFLVFIQLNAMLCISTSLPTTLLGSAFGLAGTFRYFIGSVASAIYISVLNNELKDNLQDDVTSAALGAGLPASSLEQLFGAIHAGNPAVMAQVPGINTSIEVAVASAAKTAYADSFKTVFLVSIAFCNSGNHVEIRKSHAFNHDHADAERYDGYFEKVVFREKRLLNTASTLHWALAIEALQDFSARQNQEDESVDQGEEQARLEEEVD